MNAGRSNGCVCAKCKTINSYADPNQADGSYLCYDCRPVSATTSAPYRAAVPRSPVGTKYTLTLYGFKDGFTYVYDDPAPITIDRTDLIPHHTDLSMLTNAREFNFAMITRETWVDGVLITTPTGDTITMKHNHTLCLLGGDKPAYFAGHFAIPAKDTIT